ncbi:hypothetical protein OBBRIDRAFT_327659 [Obba rivulosa]|uniref:C2H2-type domain-containing protein n=1 Tax=Obba rivulosa TaxID=1052685 RepID=A0A8E2DPG0_9APHY|nr:hypothetical protein OBBRIDRAFT_327659 [Obba rivulosa]
MYLNCVHPYCRCYREQLARRPGAPRQTLHQHPGGIRDKESAPWHDSSQNSIPHLPRDHSYSLFPDPHHNMWSPHFFGAFAQASDDATYPTAGDRETIYVPWETQSIVHQAFKAGPQRDMGLGSPPAVCVRPCTLEQYRLFYDAVVALRSGRATSIPRRAVVFTAIVNEWPCHWHHDCGTTLKLTERKDILEHFRSDGSRNKPRVACEWDGCKDEVAPQGLWRHFLLKHLGQEHCVCLLCGTVTSRIDALKRHVLVDCKASMVVQGIGFVD